MLEIREDDELNVFPALGRQNYETWSAGIIETLLTLLCLIFTLQWMQQHHQPNTVQANIHEHFYSQCSWQKSNIENKTPSSFLNSKTTISTLSMQFFLWTIFIIIGLILSVAEASFAHPHPHPSCTDKNWSKTSLYYAKLILRGKNCTDVITRSSDSPLLYLQPN